ncbi:MAG: hypothetical protein LBT01_09400 [Spirochaetaceae bacterium]|jgi:hypothetical protein|nr:hypothetical protein [Spirochaetaceae bacterium]
MGYVSTVINLLKTSMIAKVVAVIIVLLLVLFVLMPLIRKLKRKRIKDKETQEIMKDLKVWRHLSQLVQGGKEHEKAKQLLSDNILKINDLFRQGFANLGDYARGLYANPWFMLLGEPHSGKSSLMRESELELVPSADEEAGSADTEGKNSLPIRFWYGAKAVICDVSGRVFFDRWLDGSSAEWSYIVDHLCHKRRRKPLNGIILTIPADALLADRDSLARKKAILMANELSYLLKTSGMRLPCYVIVTKLDMINGFREFARAIKGDLAHQCIAYKNETAMYDKEAFKPFWAELVDRLVLGSRQMFSRNVDTFYNADDGSEDRSMDRLNVNGKLYVFPQNFNALYKNLDIYLESLFGKDNYHGTRSTYFEGVAFTSASDSGLSLSPALAALSGLHTDELVLRETKQARSGSYFVRDMLHRWVFTPSPHLGFTGHSSIRAQLPHYAVSAALLGISACWLLGALFNSTKLSAELSQQIAYYDSLNTLLKKGTPFESPLIKKDEMNNSWTLNEEPLLGEIVSSRVQFYFNALSYRDIRIDPPLGFYLSSALIFGPGRSMGYQTKAYITNQLYGTMARTPILKNFGRKLVEERNQSIVLDTTLREAIVSFVLLDQMRNAELHRIFRSKQFNLKPVIQCLLEDVSNNTMSLLTSYEPRYDRDYSFTLDANYIYSDDFLQAKEAALDTMLSAWSRFTVYPDSLYGKIKQLVSISEEIVSNFDAINSAFPRIDSVSSIDELRSVAGDWGALVSRHTNLVVTGRTLFAEISEKLNAAHIPISFNLGNKIPDPFGDNLINTFLFNDIVISLAEHEYEELFNADMAYIEKELSTARNNQAGRMNALRNDFKRNMTVDIALLQSNAAALKANDLYVKKMDDKPDALSYFFVTDQALALASDIEIPTPQSIRKTGARSDWMSDRYNINGVIDKYDSFAKPFLDNKSVSAFLAATRNMLIGEAYLNRYIVFDTFYPFLKEDAQIIAVNIETSSKDATVFSFSESAIRAVIGIMDFDKRYDPVVVKDIIGNITVFLNLFKSADDKTPAPAFLQNLDRALYETASLQNYLGSYIAYWQNYADNSYNPVARWTDYKYRVSMIKSYQTNTVLQDVYTKSIEFINNVDDSTLSQTSLALKTDAVGMLNDRIKFLSAFMTTDAERMLSSWSELSGDAETAIRTLQNLSIQDVKDKYMTIYSGKKEIRIGWWDNFIMDGITVLSKEFSTIKLNQFEALKNRIKAFPICVDAPLSTALTPSDVTAIAALLSDLGAGLLPLQSVEQTTDALVQSKLHPVLFTGETAQRWAQTVYGFAGAVSNTKTPFVWTLLQPSVSDQSALPANGRILTINRFRYIRVSSGARGEQAFNTYSNQPLTLTQGRAQELGISIKFFRTSGERNPDTTFSVEGLWAIFQLYLQSNGITNDKGQRLVPIYFEDELGSYVYFVEVATNNPIPAAELWYTGAAWPNLQQVNGFISGDNISSPESDGFSPEIPAPEAAPTNDALTGTSATDTSATGTSAAETSARD